MATSAMTVRLDTKVKEQFDTLCQQFGMSSNTAINIFVKQVIRSRSIPFTVALEPSNTGDVRQQALATFMQQREAAELGRTPEMTLGEINKEIHEVRRAQKSKLKAQES